MWWLCRNCCEEDKTSEARISVIQVAPHLDEVLFEKEPLEPPKESPLQVLKAGEPTWQVPQIDSKEPLAFVESESIADSTFKIEIDPRLGEVELDIDTSDPDVCIVSQIHPLGLLAQWNASCHREVMVLDYCRILKVDHVSGRSENLLNAMRQKKRVVLTLERPRFKEVRIKRDGTKLGFTLTGFQSAAGIIVDKVNEALEKTLREADQIRPHDRILQVNDVDAMSVDPSMLEAPELRLKLACYSKFSL